MDEQNEKRWRDEQAADRVASNVARAAMAQAMRLPSQWAAQAAELLIWGLKVTAATLAIAVVVLALLKLFVTEQIDARNTALTGAIIVVGMLIPFTRKLWPSSPFRKIWLATYQARRAARSDKNT